MCRYALFMQAWSHILYEVYVSALKDGTDRSFAKDAISIYIITCCDKPQQGLFKRLSRDSLQLVM